LCRLPARRRIKTRWHFDDDRTYVVDVFDGSLAGLILAELELAPGGARPATPRWARTEVTNDDRYWGGRLAVREPADVASLRNGPVG
jgi:CYTH domain-containing protein